MKISVKILVTLFLLLSLLVPQKSFAHVVQTDGSIGGVLHVDPDDEPYAKQVSNFFVSITDRQSKFDAQKCYCGFTIYENEREIYYQDLQDNPSKSSLNFSFIFPQKDVYKVVVKGRPSVLGAFQEFTLTYDIRVDREGSTQSSNQNNDFVSTHFIHLIVAAGILLFVIVAFIIQTVSKPKS